MSQQGYVDLLETLRLELLLHGIGKSVRTVHAGHARHFELIDNSGISLNGAKLISRAVRFFDFFHGVVAIFPLNEKIDILFQLKD